MGFTNGIPEYGIHDLLFPYDIAERAWSFIKTMLENMHYNGIDYIIKGEAILPELITKLLKKYPNKINMCFIGYAHADYSEKMKAIKEFSTLKNDWLYDKTDTYILEHIKNMMAHSSKIKKILHNN